MASQIILKKSSVAARVPVAEDLAYGELALNYADGLLYFKKSDGVTIVAMGSGSGSVTSVAALTLTTDGNDITSTVETGTTTPVITLNIPNASASNRGALTAADWTTFNGKQAALGFTPYNATNPSGYTSNTGTVTSVAAITLGTTGTDLSSTVTTGTTNPVITLNIPTASVSNRGVLSSSDWSTFNNKQAALGFTPENVANKGAANGYAPLDATSKISSTYLPSYVDDVLESTNLAGLPATGETGKIYVTLDTNKTYRWSGSAYVEISASPGSTDVVTEGSTNLYFTTARARSAISATQNITYNASTGVITGPVLTGYLTAESDTLATVTGRGATTATAVTFSGGITGNVTGNLTGNATGLSSILSIASGGTGTATPALVAGVNVTISGTWPNQTINSTAGGTGTVTSVAAITLTTTGTDITSSVATGTTTPVITLNIPNASAANRGALTSADWTTFNGKQAALGFTPYNATNPSGYTSNSGTVTSVAAITLTTTGTDITSTVATGTTTPVITLNIPTASAANRGALSAADWTTFNGKQAALGFTPYNATNPSGYTSNTGTVTSVAALTISTTGTDITSTVATGTTTPVITINIPTASAANRGALSAADWSTFNGKQAALGFTPYNATNPSGYTSNSGTVTSVAALTIGTTGTDITSTVATGTTTPVITINIPTASAANRGVLSAADWTTFNGKQAAGTYATGTGSASGTNTGDETLATIKTKLGITTLSGSNTGDQTIPTTLPNANAITFSSTGGAVAGSTYTGAAVLTVDYSTVGAAAAGHTHSYQAADADLLAIGGLVGTTGLLKKTAADTWTLDTSAYTTNLGTVTSVGGTGTVSGLTLSGTVTTSGNLTLGGTLAVTAANFASQTATTVLAAPTLAAGIPTFRVLTLEDLPDAWIKRSVAAATTANITLSAPQTIDGIVLVAGNRVLVKNQTLSQNNGIYVVAAAAWTRALDADTIGKLAGAHVNVDSGTVNGGLSFDTDLKSTDVLGTTAMAWNRLIDSAYIIPVAQGGTGTATPGLVQGTNVTITGTWPNQTINSTASGGSSVGTTLTDTVASWAKVSIFTGVINPTDVFFKSDGTKLFLATASALNQYTLSTPWDITTAGTVTSVTNTWDTGLLGVFISPDGTKLVTCGQTAVVNAGLGIVASEDRAYYLTLSTAWDITTATLVSSLKFGAGVAGLPVAETAPQGITFNSTGTIMYMIGSTNDAIYQYTLTTAYDVSTATYLQQLSIAAFEAGTACIRFNIAGTRVYFAGSTEDKIFEFRLSTAWDISTAVYYDSLYIGRIESTIQGLFLEETSGNAYIVGNTMDDVVRFNTNSPGILIAPTLATGRIDIAGNTRIKDGDLYVTNDIIASAIVTTGGVSFGGNLTANQISTSTSAITLGSSVTTGATALSTAQTTGTIIIGGGAGTGAITLGQSTVNQTINIGSAATVASSTKIINIGLGGVSASTTNINIGSAVSGAINNITLNGTVYSTSGGFKFPDGTTQTTAVSTALSPFLLMGA